MNDDLTAEQLRWLAFPTTRWLVSCEVDPDPFPIEGRRPTMLDPGGNLPALTNLVHLAATREGAVRTVEAEAGREIDRWYRVGRHLGFDTWTNAQPDGSWTRYRIQPVESSIDVTPSPGYGALIEHTYNSQTTPDPLDAMAVGHTEGLVRAVLERAADHGCDPDAVTFELTRLDVEGIGTDEEIGDDQ